MSNNTFRHYDGGPKTPEEIEEFWRDLGREPEIPLVVDIKPSSSDN
jgi:hypothetical protein